MLAKDGQPEIRATAIWSARRQRPQRSQRRLAGSHERSGCVGPPPCLRGAHPRRFRAAGAMLSGRCSATMTASCATPPAWCSSASTPKKWADNIGKENERPGRLERHHRSVPDQPGGRVWRDDLRTPAKRPAAKDTKDLLDYLRTVEMALIHVRRGPIGSRGLPNSVRSCSPHTDWPSTANWRSC